MSKLDRFISAQEYNYSDALKEIKNGQKISHWMWYVFPQIKGLGKSDTAKWYAIKDLQEAKDYLNNEVLSNRLEQICKALLELDCNDAYKIFGSPDDMKLKSSMTLFEIAAPENKILKNVLDKYFNGERDQKTVKIISSMQK